MTVRRGWDRIFHFVTAGKGWGKTAIRQAQQNIAAILQTFDDDMRHARGWVALQSARYMHQPSSHHYLTESGHNLGPEHKIGHPGFILYRDEANPLGAAGALTHQHQACQLQAAAIARAG